MHSVIQGLARRIWGSMEPSETYRIRHFYNNEEILVIWKFFSNFSGLPDFLRWKPENFEQMKNPLDSIFGLHSFEKYNPAMPLLHILGLTYAFAFVNHRVLHFLRNISCCCPRAQKSSGYRSNCRHYDQLIIRRKCVKQNLWKNNVQLWINSTYDLRRKQLAHCK